MSKRTRPERATRDASIENKPADQAERAPIDADALEVTAEHSMEVPPWTVDEVDVLRKQAQQNPAYEPPEGMRLDSFTNELVPLRGWSFNGEDRQVIEPE